MRNELDELNDRIARLERLIAENKSAAWAKCQLDAAILKRNLLIESMMR